MKTKKLLLIAGLMLTFTAFGAQQVVNTGTSPNDGTGDSLRASFGKLNANDADLYSQVTAIEAVTNLVTTNNAPGTIVQRGLDGNIAYPRVMTVLNRPTNIFTSTATYSCTQNSGSLMPNNIMTSSAGGFDPTSTNLTSKALGVGMSITLTGTVEQYIVTKVIDSTHAYMFPPFVNTHANLTGEVSPNAYVTTDDTGTFQGGLVDGGGNTWSPNWGNNQIVLWDSNGTNSFFICSGLGGNPFGCKFFSVRSAYNFHDILNLACTAPADALTVDPDGSVSFRYGITNNAGTPIISLLEFDAPLGLKANAASAITLTVTNSPIIFGSIKINYGTGSPNSAVTGSIGDQFYRTDGGTSTTLYVKESGTATTTGWVAK